MLDALRQQSSLMETTQWDYRRQAQEALRMECVSDTLSEHELSLIEWSWRTGTLEPYLCSGLIRIDRRNAGAAYMNKVFSGVAEPIGHGRYQPVITCKCVGSDITARFLVRGTPNSAQQHTAQAMANEWAVHADQRIREALADIGLTEG